MMLIKTRKNNNQLLSITRYIIEKYKLTQSVKLQKILYFLYLEYLKATGKKLFKEEFEAWIYGPVVPKISSYIKDNGFNFSEIEHDEYIEEIMPLADQEIINFIDKTIPTYLNYETDKLVEMTHSSLPWKKAREGLNYDDLCTKRLTLEDMKIYAQSENFNWQ